ncbi:DUF4019 domain-containing protein [Pseudomonas sp. MAFF 301449]|uniref:DUF4019 domain-containing protein n=1 Tax=Pseudomonas cyclaminis TaxID=2781239 RepID=A0ABR9SKU6_9PSED|nr:DUF4019 domain-containing protein [Pseudomonas cyclaminis]MBE8589527.1 DUF4019 domain-containing protein [Pseudomonas cyclaminis]MBE8602441.1 DUF4019 domain-containing protein [Pseudomonas cyclaminis]
MKLLAVMVFSLALLSGCDISFNNNTPKVIANDFGTPQQQQHVFDTAVGFLTLLDSGKAELTWPAVSPVLQAKTSALMWASSLKGLRLGLGSFQKREPVAIGFIDQMPDAPAGNYAVIEFASTFSTTTVQEKVIVRDDDKHWGIVGYFVNKRVVFGEDARKAP